MENGLATMMMSGPATIGAAAVLVALMLFGILYDLVVRCMEQRYPSHGYVAFLVVGGVGATLVGMAVLDVLVQMNAGLLGLCCFAASGGPMVTGSVIRHILEQAEQQAKALAVAREMLQDD